MPIPSHLHAHYSGLDLKTKTSSKGMHVRFIFAVLLLFGSSPDVRKVARKIRVALDPLWLLLRLVRRSRHLWNQHPCRHRYRLQLILRPRRRPPLLLSCCEYPYPTADTDN